MKIVYNGEMDTRLCKEVLGATIPEILESDSDVVYLDADLMSCIGTLKYGAQHRDRAIDCGIAEANMAGVAAGLAMAGFKPIIHSFGIFASRRCFDQVFLSGGYAKNDITVLGSDPGVTAAMNGGTHMPFEDVALYRASWYTKPCRLPLLWKSRAFRQRWWIATPSNPSTGRP